MAVNWYPGHMHKASKELQPLLKNCQVFLEILDARFPLASSNPLHAERHEQLPSIRILNKSDLAEEQVTREWQAYFQQTGSAACLISSKEYPVSKEALVDEAEHLFKQSKSSGSKIKQKLLVITGIPNVGKSSLLNHWCGRKLAKTRNEAAITRGQQRVHLQGQWYLVDTPGLLWPKLQDQEAACLLAAFGSIRQTAMDEEEVAWQVSKRLLLSHGQLLQQRYELPSQPQSVEDLYAAIADQRGALRYGQPDNYRVAQILLNDLSAGRIGRLSPERPPATTNSG